MKTHDSKLKNDSQTTANLCSLEIENFPRDHI